MTVLPLFATLAALGCGPLLYALARPRPAVLAFLDGFVLVSIAGLVLLEVVPGAFGDGGAWSLGFLALGAIGPSVVEQGLHQARRKAHLATLALAILGLLLHSIGDGVALAPGHGTEHGHAHDALAIAVIVHSVPVGLVVWWVMAPVFGPRWPSITLALMCVGTVAGYVFGLELNEVIGERAFAWFQALVAGSILHVVFGRPHLEEDSEHRDAPPPFEGLGNLTALAGLIVLDLLDPHADALIEFLRAVLNLAALIVPVLVLAPVLGALAEPTPNQTGTAPSGSAGLRLLHNARSQFRAALDRSAGWTLAIISALALLLASASNPVAISAGWPWWTLAVVLALPVGRYAAWTLPFLAVPFAVFGSVWAAVLFVTLACLVRCWMVPIHAADAASDRSLRLLLILVLGPVLGGLAGAWLLEALSLMLALYLLSLLRCGGRRWVAQPYGDGQSHSHTHSH